jgi:hypothetical protein
MARNAGPTTEILLNRIREQGAFGISFNFALETLSRCQRIANAGLQIVQARKTLTTEPNRLIYDYRNSLPAAIHILSIYDGTRTLQKFTNLTDLAAYDITFWRATGTRFEAYTQIGRDLLLLYPAKTTASSVTVVYSKLTNEFTDYHTHYDTALELPDEDVDFAVNLAEIVLLLQSRRLPAALAMVESLQEDVTKHLSEGGR